MINNFLPLNHAVIEVLPHRVKNESSPTWSFPYGRTFWKVMFVIKCISRLSANTEWGPDREHFVLICTAHLCVLHVLSAAAAFPHLVVKWSCKWSTFTVSIDMLMIKLKYRKKVKITCLRYLSWNWPKQVSDSWESDSKVFNLNYAHFLCDNFYFIKIGNAYLKCELWELNMILVWNSCWTVLSSHFIHWSLYISLSSPADQCPRGQDENGNVRAKTFVLWVECYWVRLNQKKEGIKVISVTGRAEKIAKSSAVWLTQWYPGWNAIW